MAKASSGFLTPARIVFYVVSAAVIAGLGFTVYSKKNPKSPIEETPRSALASYLSAEHARCWSDAAHAAGKFTVKEAAGVPDGCKDWLGQDVSADWFAGSGLKFLDAGRCSVPPERCGSAHFRFETDGTKGPAGQHVSLYLQKYLGEAAGQADLPPDSCVWLKPGPELGSGAPTMVVWKPRGGLVYYIVAESPAARDTLRAGLRVPEPTKGL